jgi:glycosyltransferase involved in cell wall biosynthesis
MHDSVSKSTGAEGTDSEGTDSEGTDSKGMTATSDETNEESTPHAAAKYWSSEYVDRMQAELGPDACRKLAIFKLPDRFLLSVVVPVFNEGETVAEVVQRLRATGLPLQIILVNDGSRDGTSEAMAEFESDADVLLIHHEVNLGKGAAIKTGFQHATGDIVVIQDADREYDPTDFRYLLQPLLSGEADVAYGTRYGHYDRQLSPWWHQSVNAFVTLLASIAIGIRLSDVETCYKMMPRQHLERILSDLQESRFGIEIELTARLARLGLRFTERPIRYQHRWYDEGKKIGWKDGVRAIYCIVKYGLFGR